MGFLTGRSNDRRDHELRRLEEKQRGAQSATQQWLQLLRDMERDGESANPRYEQYYRAYADAQQLQKRIDLELFNLRQGLRER